MICEGKGQMKAKQRIDAGIASRADLPGTIRNAFKEGNVVDGSEKTWHGRN